MNEKTEERRAHCEVNDQKIKTLEGKYDGVKKTLYGENMDGLTYNFTSLKSRINFLTSMYVVQTLAIIAGVVKLWTD